MNRWDVIRTCPPDFSPCNTIATYEPYRTLFWSGWSSLFKGLRPEAFFFSNAAAEIFTASRYLDYEGNKVLEWLPDHGNIHCCCRQALLGKIDWDLHITHGHRPGCKRRKAIYPTIGSAITMSGVIAGIQGNIHAKTMVSLPELPWRQRVALAADIGNNRYTWDWNAYLRLTGPIPPTYSYGHYSDEKRPMIIMDTGAIRSSNDGSNPPRSSSIEQSVASSQLSSAPTLSALALPDGPHRSRNRKLHRFGLPITVIGLDGPATVMACADSGSEENIIHLDLANSLGLFRDADDPSGIKQFMLANGTIVTSVGKALAYCAWANEPEPELETETFPCWFYIFEKLASSMIMSDNFLRATQIMTECRYRLVPRPIAFPQAFCVNAIGKTRKRLLCRLNHKVVLASADSGSELDLMSRNHALKEGYTVRASAQKIMFADGTIGKTCGIVRLRMSIARGDTSRTSSSMPWKKSKAVKFHLLEDLATAVIVGEHTLERFKVFSLSEGALITMEAEDEVHELNRIRVISGVERAASNLRTRLARFFGRTPADPVTSILLSTGDDMTVFQQQLNREDQEEHSRRDVAKARIASMLSYQRAAAQSHEDERIRTYDEDRRLKIREFDVSQFQSSPTTSTETHIQSTTDLTPSSSAPTNTSSAPAVVTNANTLSEANVLAALETLEATVTETQGASAFPSPSEQSGAPLDTHPSAILGPDAEEPAESPPPPYSNNTIRNVNRSIPVGA